MIEFRNVCKKYETGTEAVKNANFVIEKGEFAFLVGASGSGKSTLIKLILKEEEPTSGRIIINGKDTTFLKPNRIQYLRRSMGVVFQDFRLLPDKTVYDNVAYAMYIVRATPKHIRRQVPMVLSLVGLSDKAKVYPNELKLKLQGTEFQKTVWKLLCDIPYGETTTYGEIAKKVAKIRKQKKYVSPSSWYGSWS